MARGFPKQDGSGSDRLAEREGNGFGTNGDPEVLKPKRGANSLSLLRRLPARLLLLLASSAAWDPSATAAKHTCGADRTGAGGTATP